MNYSNYKTEDLINCLPQNRPLYKDSGLWQVRSDDMDEVYLIQQVNESLRDFIIRYIESLPESDRHDIIIDLSCFPDVVKEKRTCAKCGSTDVIMFTADLDICNNCGCTQDGV